MTDFVPSTTQCGRCRMRFRIAPVLFKAETTRCPECGRHFWHGSRAVSPNRAVVGMTVADYREFSSVGRGFDTGALRHDRPEPGDQQPATPDRKV